MADNGNVETELNGVEDDKLKRVLKSIFRYILKDLRFGRAEDGTPSKNFGGGFFRGTTHVTPGTEFTVEHTFARTPYLVIPVLPLDVVGATMVPLTVSRAADSAKVYLTSTAASAPVSLYIEG